MRVYLEKVLAQQHTIFFLFTEFFFCFLFYLPFFLFYFFSGFFALRTCFTVYTWTASSSFHFKFHHCSTTANKFKFCKSIFVSQSLVQHREFQLAFSHRGENIEHELASIFQNIIISIVNCFWRKFINKNHINSWKINFLFFHKCNSWK